MTLPVYAPTIAFGNGVATSFDFDFPITQADYLRVTVENTLTGTITTLSLNGDYTVTGVGEDDGGSVIMNHVYLATDKIVILSIEPYLQGVTVLNQGGLYPQVLEDALDRVDRQVQQLKEKSDRSIAGTPGSVFAELGGALQRANKYLGFDSAGNPSLVTSIASIGALTSLAPFVDNALLRWNGTSGTSIQGSLATIDDIGRLVINVLYDGSVADQVPTSVDINTTTAPGYTGHARGLRLDGVVGSADVLGNAMTHFVNAVDRNIAGPGGILLNDAQIRDNTRLRSSLGAPGGSTGYELGVHGSGKDDAEARTIMRLKPKGLASDTSSVLDDFYVKAGLIIGNHHYDTYDRPYTLSSIQTQSWAIIGVYLDADAGDGGIITGIQMDDIYDTGLWIRDPRNKGILIDIGSHPGGYKDSVAYPSKKADYGIQIIGEPNNAHFDIFASGPQGVLQIGRNTTASGVNTIIGEMRFTALDSVSNFTTYAAIRGVSQTATDGSEVGELHLAMMRGGVDTDLMYFREGGFQVPIVTPKPSAPPADKGIVYFDKPAAKVRMMVRFPTGPEQQIAIEP